MISTFGICVSLALAFPSKEPRRSAASESPSQESRSRLRDDNCAILKFDKRLMAEIGKYEGATITQADYPTIDSLLSMKVGEYNLAQSRQLAEDRKTMPDVDSASYFIDLSRYKIQLVGLAGKTGERLAYVNCVGRHYEDFWRTRLISMLDGGNSFFHLFVDLDRKIAIGFRVNGEA